ncbi:MAG TPA: carbohydrate ABC transporter permease [Chloroflexota bacterium]|nr:carbohydrate ABC transporter permease [Chloroflexota bacterium]
MTHRRIKPSAAAAYAILVLFGLFFLLPFIWLIVASFTPNATLSTTVPNHVGLDNFRFLFDNGDVFQPFGNSLLLGLSTMVITITLAGLAAYPLSRYQFRFKRPLMYAILFASGLPILALVTPLYAMYVSLNLIDTTRGVILFLVASALPFSIWLMKNFLDSVPVELEEAAWVDGASVLGSFWRVVLPLSAPGIAVVGILSFLNAYTNFFVPFIIYTTASHFPASVQLFIFFGSYGQVNYGQLAAFAMLYALPAVALYMVVSRFLVRGINVGGLRG